MIRPQSIDQIVDDIKQKYLGQKVYLVQEAGKFDDEMSFLKFVKKNRMKVENGDGFTRYLLLMNSSTPAEPHDEETPDETSETKNKK